MRDEGCGMRVRGAGCGVRGRVAGVRCGVWGVVCWAAGVMRACSISLNKSAGHVLSTSTIPTMHPCPCEEPPALLTMSLLTMAPARHHRLTRLDSALRASRSNLHTRPSSLPAPPRTSAHCTPPSHHPLARACAIVCGSWNSEEMASSG